MRSVEGSLRTNKLKLNMVISWGSPRVPAPIKNITFTAVYKASSPMRKRPAPAPYPAAGKSAASAAELGILELSRVRSPLAAVGARIHCFVSVRRIHRRGNALGVLCRAVGAQQHGVDDKVCLADVDNLVLAICIGRGGGVEFDAVVPALLMGLRWRAGNSNVGYGVHAHYFHRVFIDFSCVIAGQHAVADRAIAHAGQPGDDVVGGFAVQRIGDVEGESDVKGVGGADNENGSGHFGFLGSARFLGFGDDCRNLRVKRVSVVKAVPVCGASCTAVLVQQL